MYNQLISEQRYDIYLEPARKLSKNRIAQEIGVHPATITREIQRYSNSDNQYVFSAQEMSISPNLLFADMGGILYLCSRFRVKHASVHA